jgi:NADH-quinone oxidoreductase subunit L
MIIGWLAIAGVPPFSGFWSKDEILASLWGNGRFGWLEWGIGIAVALLTAFYMTRLVIMTFFGGKEKWREPDPAAVRDDDEYEDAPDAHHIDASHTPHESPWTMTVPLILLAGGALVIGGIQLPFDDSVKQLELWLEPVLAHAHDAPPAIELAGLALGAVLLAFVGIWLAYRVYQQHKIDPERIEREALVHALYIDETYAKVVGGPGEAGFTDVAEFDSQVVDGSVNGIGRIVQWIGKALRPVQSGFVRSYALAVAGGAVMLLLFVVLRMST